MSAGFLKVPIGFERRADVRLFGRQLQGLSNTWDGAACAFHIWMEFAEVGMDWRPLRLPFGGDPEVHDWVQEEVTFLIESAANFCLTSTTDAKSGKLGWPNFPPPFQPTQLL